MVMRAMAEKLVSRHVSADGTSVRANASYKSLVTIKMAKDPSGVQEAASSAGLEA
jgi:hypothetical protein